MKRRLNSQSIHAVIPYLILGLILFIQGVAIYSLNAGKFLYILDDPYIHLSLARNIAHGHYGINLVEPSAPSSSILWPFILAIFARLPLFEYVPLLLNIGFALATLFFIHKIIDLIFQHTLSSAKKTFFVALFIIICSMTPLIWSGMEHMLQILLTVIVMYQLLEIQINQKLHKSLIGMLVLLSLVRYESLAISIPILVFLYFKGYRKLAATGLISIIALLAAFSYFIHSLGLDYLPTSVLIKRSLFSNRNSFDLFLRTIFISMQSRTWFILLGMVLLIGLKLRQKTHKLFISITALSITLYLLFGTTLGSFYRYETFIITYSIIVFMYLYREFLIKILSSTRKQLFTSIFISLLLFIYLDYAHPIIYTPKFSNSVYLQQYQMALFTDQYYKKNVGVNDIGLIAFTNDNYTLDLFGLSNIDVIDYRKSQTPGWMDQLSTQYDANLIMIYDEWFTGFIPNDWIKLGQLKLDLPVAIVAYKEVSFYVRNPAMVEEVKQLLEQFSRTLPEHAEFHFTQE
ncbi:hypothetical protein [Herpetosiphon llansteffanensis]|uniref:hypothetical protein n=1 Tax=Herpetosiphon llansteffanensis TaxID=2094568 RepID=UPI000D7BB27B|nr:hypothetical protein [Herpetosiphon llansteffanensis]